MSIVVCVSMPAARVDFILVSLVSGAITRQNESSLFRVFGVSLPPSFIPRTHVIAAPVQLLANRARDPHRP